MAATSPTPDSSRAADTRSAMPRAPSSPGTRSRSSTDRPSSRAPRSADSRRGGASCSATTVQNAPVADGVTITYAIHPFLGRRVSVWRRQTLRGTAVVIVDMPGGFRRAIPIDWTDMRPSRLCPRTQGRLVVFDPWVLLGLTQIVAEKLTTASAGSESRRFDSGKDVTAIAAREGRGQRRRETTDRTRATGSDRAVVRRSRPTRSDRRRS